MRRPPFAGLLASTAGHASVRSTDSRMVPNTKILREGLGSGARQADCLRYTSPAKAGGRGTVAPKHRAKLGDR